MVSFRGVFSMNGGWDYYIYTITFSHWSCLKQLHHSEHHLIVISGFLALSLLVDDH